MADQKSEFEIYWKKFTDTIRENLISESKKRGLTYSYACRTLKDCLLVWKSECDEEGRWLKAFADDDTQKAAKLKNIILDSVSFKEEQRIPALPERFKITLPVLTTALVVLVSILFDRSWIFTLVTSMISLIFVIPAAKKLVDTSGEKAAQKLVDNYMEQLNKYMFSVISLLEQKD